MPAFASSSDVPVATFTFCLRSSLCTTFAISASSAGSNWSSISISTTSVPKRPNADAISVPDAPAPTTARRFGRSFISQVAAVSSTRPSKLVPGTGSETEPVASTTFAASYSVSPTVTLPLPASLPEPSSRSILCFLKRLPTPPVSVFTTLSRCFPAAPMSNDTSPASTPNSAPSLSSVRTSAARSIAFAGMQATLRQRPPTNSRSTQAVFMPSCAARIAAT